MKRALLCVVSLLALGLIAPACSTIGDPGGMPDGLPHGGTGAFRLLDNEETGISGSPGAAMFLFEPAFENAMVQGDFVFFTAAPPLDEPPMPPEDFPRNEIYWEAFQPRRIQRGVRREEGFAAFDPADEVLTASEPWEGEEIFDPWVVEDGGTFRMYYAGDGGIGVAEASALDGTFTRVAGPVLGPDDAASGSPRRPSVVRGPDGDWLMYYDAGGEIRLARSSDGVAFSPVGAISLEGEDLGESPEVEARNPGAITVTTSAGRSIVRVYFESIREDGTHRIYVAGSFDGVEFERHELQLFESVDLRFPAPLTVDTRVTLLYASLPAFSRGRISRNLQVRALVVGAAPAGESFLPESEAPAE